MSAPVRTILQVNTRDRRGGAEQVALNLHRGYRRRGLDAWLAVGDRRSEDEGVLELSMAAGRGAAYRAWRGIADRAGGVARAADAWRGIEAFHYPATYRLPTLAPRAPDIIHAHNLHGGYFDLRALPWLGERAPVALTLHDAWLLSGHCSHSFDCQRWRTGCGDCPDLTIYPAVRRDRTARNWRRKQGIYAGSRLFVATPCAWLMDRVEASMLDAGIVDRRVIPNGVDRSVFTPRERAAARRALGLPPDTPVLLFVAAGVRGNPFKDWRTLRAAVDRIAAALDGPLLFLALGDSAKAERIGRAELRFVPFEDDPADVAQYYQAADLYVHAARADTFPNSVLEALACGTPVVATAVGGIPEQVRDLDAQGPEAGTGALVEGGDPEALAHAVLRILGDPGLHERLGLNAARDARDRFDLETQVDGVLAWYADVVEQWAAR